LLLKIGNRKGRRHYRVSTGHKKNSLRFEAEMKGDLIKDFHDLLVASTFEQQDFESRLSYQFLKYSFQLFSISNQTFHIDWLMDRIRPFQCKNTLHIQDSIIHSHYLNQMDFKQIKEKQHLITLLKLLVFVRGLDYTPGQLTSKFRKYNFPLRKFLKFINNSSTKKLININ
jgi:hypothetical protein